MRNALIARRWPRAELPSEEELLDCIDRGEWACPLEERWLRVAALRRASERLKADEVDGDKRSAANTQRLEATLGDGPEALMLRAAIASARGEPRPDLLDDHPWAGQFRVVGLRESPVGLAGAWRPNVHWL